VILLCTFFASSQLKKADLIVAGSQGHSALSRFFPGGISQKVLVEEVNETERVWIEKSAEKAMKTFWRLTGVASYLPRQSETHSGQVSRKLERRLYFRRRELLRQPGRVISHRQHVGNSNSSARELFGRGRQKKAQRKALKTKAQKSRSLKKNAGLLIEPKLARPARQRGAKKL
jgi:hypothetical protein